MGGKDRYDWDKLVAFLHRVHGYPMGILNACSKHDLAGIYCVVPDWTKVEDKRKYRKEHGGGGHDDECRTMQFIVQRVKGISAHKLSHMKEADLKTYIAKAIKEELSKTPVKKTFPAKSESKTSEKHKCKAGSSKAKPKVKLETKTFSTSCGRVKWRITRRCKSHAGSETKSQADSDKESLCSEPIAAKISCTHSKARHSNVSSTCSTRGRSRSFSSSSCHSRSRTPSPPTCDKPSKGYVCPLVIEDAPPKEEKKEDIEKESVPEPVEVPDVVEPIAEPPPEPALTPIEPDVAVPEMETGLAPEVVPAPVAVALSSSSSSSSSSSASDVAQAPASPVLVPVSASPQSAAAAATPVPSPAAEDTPPVSPPALPEDSPALPTPSPIPVTQRPQRPGTPVMTGTMLQRPYSGYGPYYQGPYGMYPPGRLGAAPGFMPWDPSTQYSPSSGRPIFRPGRAGMPPQPRTYDAPVIYGKVIPVAGDGSCGFSALEIVLSSQPNIRFEGTAADLRALLADHLPVYWNGFFSHPVYGNVIRARWRPEDLEACVEKIRDPNTWLGATLDQFELMVFATYFRVRIGIASRQGLVPYPGAGGRATDLGEDVKYAWLTSSVWPGRVLAPVYTYIYPVGMDDPGARDQLPDVYVLLEDDHYQAVVPMSSR